MGDYIISIQGVGPHDNRGSSVDADVLTDEFVQRLIAAGHRIDVATFLSGSRFDIATNRRKPAAAEAAGEEERCSG